MQSDDPLNFPHKPVEDGFAFDVETDSLADTMGLRLPNRSLYVLQGVVGAGKSLIAQRLVHGMLHNGVKVLVVTTELTTRVDRTDGVDWLRRYRCTTGRSANDFLSVRHCCRG